MKKRSVERKIIIGLVAIVVLLVGASVAPSIWSGFTGMITGDIAISTATVDLEIVEYSGTWVYKDLITDERIVSPVPLDGPDLLLVAYSKAIPGAAVNQFEIVGENIYPCIYFKSDIIFHYIGSIPVKVFDFDIQLDGNEDLEQYITWDAYRLDTGEEVGIGTQLHYCDYVYLEIVCKIPQDDTLQGLHLTGTVTIIVIQWDEFCDEPDCCDMDMPGDVTFNVTHNSPISYFDVNLTNSGDWNGHYLAWCVDSSTGMPIGQELIGTLWCPWDDDNPYPDDDWDMVAWVINHKNASATSSDIQHAIWYFIDGGYTGTDPEVLSMIADAEVNGEGYHPSVGEICPIVLYSTYQIIFIEVLLEV